MTNHVQLPPEQREAVTLSAEEAELARGLLVKLLTQGERPATTSSSAAPVEDVGQRRIQSIARAIYQSRRKRNEHFGSALFSEPAWDMLLVLFIYGDRGDQMSVTKLAEFSESPLTTAIRWLDYLESQRLITRTQCPSDRRKFFVTLSEKGRSTLKNYFLSLIEAGSAPPIG